MLNSGHKIVCINNSNLSDRSKLLLNHIYTTKKTSSFLGKSKKTESKIGYRVELEGNDNYYFEYRFITLREYRKQKLNKLCSK